jgi:hypothetical protein
MLKSTGDLGGKTAGQEELRGRANDTKDYGDYAELNKESVVRLGANANDKDKMYKKREVNLEYRDEFGRLLTRKEAFAKAAKFGSLFLETHVLWHGLVFQKNAHERDTSHQVSQADEQWRGILEEVSKFVDPNRPGCLDAEGGGEEGGEGEAEAEEKNEGIEDAEEAEEKKEAGEGAEEDAPLAAADADGRALVHGCAYTALSHFPALHERSVEVRDIFKAVRKGEDTRKLMRRMSRRQSNMQKATNHALSVSLQHAK